MAKIKNKKVTHTKNCLIGESFPNIFASFLYPVIYTSLPFFATSAIFKTHMPNPRSPEEVLWNVFPLLLIAIALVGGIILLPRLNATNLDDRSRASEPTKLPTSPKDALTQPTSRKADTPEIICSALYDPVCDPKTGTTYPNSCEASLAKVTTTTPGECTSNKPLILPNSN